MAYPVANGSVCAVSLIGKHENQEVMTVLHYRVSAGGTIDDGKAALEQLWAALVAVDGLVSSWRECLSQNVVALRGQVQWIDPARFAFLPQTITPGQGAIGGDAYPVNTAVAITRRTEFSGRNQVATIHMPGVPMTFVENGNVVNDPAGLAYNFFAEKTLEVQETGDPAAEWFPIPFSRSTPETAKQLVSYTLQPTARVQRRRTVGLGS